ncbi:helicase associated domain-containing protein [Puniceicoccus vermicola]|uniref:Helicase associated domain-containing protein n=1 Tax=Puniceicoccus vermicola TaxID=388746 RepID=A0A7X1AZQ2_9BACT|nr:helicase associated domain-containing protein [Puniceicoccus vermicola]MBC2601845.1 helicase associated domain-containing protein [Puniceicoccus vermicola]
MAKRKSKKRKGHLARPPKRKKKDVFQPRPVTLTPEDEAFLEGEMPSSPPKTKPARNAKKERIHPSLDAVARFPQFNVYCRKVRETVSDELTTFAVEDVPTAKHRAWLRRYLKMEAKGELDQWRKELLDRIGFNWSDGLKRISLNEKPDEKEIAAWEEEFERLRVKIHGAPMPLAALMRVEEDLFQWTVDQLALSRPYWKKTLIDTKFKELFSGLASSMSPLALKRWRSSWINFQDVYPDGSGLEKKEDIEDSRKGQADRWADRQRTLKKSGKLADWQKSLLDEIGFHWGQVDAVVRMHARWYANLDRLLELESIHGKPISNKLAKSEGLNSWISRMRKHYSDGELPPEIIENFEAKGFEFDGETALRNRMDRDWEKHYKRLQGFREEFGHVRVPASFVEDPDLGVWLTHQRERMRNGKIQPEKRKALEDLGVASAPRGRASVQISPWRKMLRRLQKIASSRPDGKLPPDLELDPKIRTWMKRQRNYFREGELDSWQIYSLREIGFDPGFVPEIPPHVQENQRRWEANLEKLRSFIAEYGHASVPKREPFMKLYVFIERTRKRWRRGEFDEEHVEQLRKAGFVFDPSRVPTSSWMDMYAKLRAYYDEKGDSAVPRKYPADQGLAEYVAQQKQRGRTGLLTIEHIRLLDELDFPWSRGRPTPRDA